MTSIFSYDDMYLVHKKIVMKKIKICFSGREKSRSDFLEDFRNAVCNFLNREAYQDLELHLYLREIIKNIFDHNNGYGFAILEKKSDWEIIIIVANEGSANNSSVTLEKHNFGIGLSAIKNEISNDHFEIKIDKNLDIPYYYKIKYKFLS